MHKHHSNTNKVLGMLVAIAMSEKPVWAWTTLEVSMAVPPNTPKTPSQRDATELRRIATP